MLLEFGLQTVSRPVVSQWPLKNSHVSGDFRAVEQPRHFHRPQLGQWNWRISTSAPNSSKQQIWLIYIFYFKTCAYICPFHGGWLRFETINIWFGLFGIIFAESFNTSWHFRALGSCALLHWKPDRTPDVAGHRNGGSTGNQGIEP